jgi:hypothetical protein
MSSVRATDDPWTAAPGVPAAEAEMDVVEVVAHSLPLQQPHAPAAAARTLDARDPGAAGDR